MKRRNQKRGILAMLAGITVISALFVSGRETQTVRSQENFTERSIVPMQYAREFDRSKWDYDSRFATNSCASCAYMDGKMYLLVYCCTYERNAASRDYLLDFFVREQQTGAVHWYDPVDQGAMLADDSCVEQISGREMHKTFYLPSIEVGGAGPKLPDVDFSEDLAGTVHAALSCAADTSSNVYLYDYRARRKGTGAISYVPVEGTAYSEPDYVTGFWYCVDRNSGAAGLSGSWQWITTDDASGTVRSLSAAMPEEATHTLDTWYLHVIARSYTGLPSQERVIEIPHSTGHTIHYDLNGGEGFFSDQTHINGDTTRIHSGEPIREGYTFLYWEVEEETYEPGEEYEKEQDGGTVTLTAVWRPNNYTIVFDGNARGGSNGSVTGSMASYDCTWETVGLPAGSYGNASLQTDGRPLFTFTGWSHTEDSLRPAYGENREDPDGYSTVPVSTIARAAGVSWTDGAVIRLYAVWDRAPSFTSVREGFFVRSHAVRGISKGEIIALAEAHDREDLGGRAFGAGTGNYDPGSAWDEGGMDRVSVVSYAPEEFESLGTVGSCDVTLRAMDWAGNITDTVVTLWITDDNAVKDRGKSTLVSPYVRRIDAENAAKDAADGGPEERSVWRLVPEYRELLQEVLEG